MSPGEKFEFCVLSGGDYVGLAAKFHATSPIGAMDIDLRVHRRENGRALKPCDAPWLEADMMAFRARALEGSVGAMLRSSGEILQVPRVRDPLWLHHCTVVLDALDVERSELVRVSGGLVTHIRKYVFVWEAIGEHNVFRTPMLPFPYVTNVFVDAWRGERLTGLEFTKLAER